MKEEGEGWEDRGEGEGKRVKGLREWVGDGRGVERQGGGKRVIGMKEWVGKGKGERGGKETEVGE